MSLQDDKPVNANRPRILGQGWRLMIWLILGLVGTGTLVMVLWWQSIEDLTTQTDNFYRRNVVARSIADDVHSLSNSLQAMAEIHNTRRFQQQVSFVNSLVQDIVQNSRELQSGYMGVDLTGGMMQQAGQLQVSTQRLVGLLQEDLQVRRRENETFSAIAAEMQDLRNLARQRVGYDGKHYQRLIRVMNAISIGHNSGDSIMMVGRMLDAAIEVSALQMSALEEGLEKDTMLQAHNKIRRLIESAGLLSIARRRLDAERELALFTREVEEDFAAFNEELVGQLDVFDRNEVRDARQTMSLVLNLHVVISAMSLLIAGFMLVGYLRNKVIEPLARNLSLLEQVLPDDQDQAFEDEHLEEDVSVEEVVLLRAKRRIEGELQKIEESNLRADSALEEARRAKYMIESANETQNAFLASLSHQIRTPMNGVTGMLEVLKRGNLVQEQRNLISVVQDSCDSLLRILDDVRDFSRLESGQLHLVSSSMVLEEVVIGIAEMSKARCLEKGLELTVCVDASLPRNLVGDAVRLRQVLGHLLDSVIDSTDRGAISIHVSSLTPRVSPVLLRFQIIGTGMPSEDVDRWRRSGQNWMPAATLTDDNVPRLGMMISENIVSLMGGQIEPLTGSEHSSGFGFEIPMESLGNSGETREFDLAGMRIGLADPGIMSRRTIENYLTADNARLLVFDNHMGLEHSLRSFASSGDPINLLVLSPYFEAGTQLDELVALIEELGDLAPRILVMTRSDEYRMPRIFEKLPSRPMTISQPVRRQSLARAVAVAAGQLDDSALMQSVSRKITRWKAPDRKVAEEASAVVLVAEDDSTARLVIGKQLEELGYIYDIAENGRKALQQLELHDYYGMVLMDCFMPELDGFDTTVKIRQREMATGRHLPITAMTASTETREIERCKQCGMDAYLGKPVTLDRLDEAIASNMPRALDLRERVEIGADAGVAAE